jgi:hypothetical protein
MVELRCGGDKHVVAWTSVRPIFTHLLFGFYLGLLAWGGLFLRDERLRALIPLRR